MESTNSSAHNLGTNLPTYIQKHILLLPFWLSCTTLHLTLDKRFQDFVQTNEPNLYFYFLLFWYSFAWCTLPNYFPGHINIIYKSFIFQKKLRFQFKQKKLCHNKVYYCGLKTVMSYQLLGCWLNYPGHTSVIFTREWARWPKNQKMSAK